MKAPLISVIMPAYNAGTYIKQAIDSILNQTYINLELLVADDCSTDETLKIIDSYNDKRVRTFHNKVNQGYLKTTNKLFVEVQGDYILFQDADDWSELNRVEIFLNEFLNDSTLGCIGSFVNKVNTFNDITSSIKFKCSYQEIIHELPSYFNCVGSALMIKKEVLEKIGGYNLYFDRIGSEDLYWYGLIVKHFKTINIPEYLYYYRATPDSISMEKNKSLKKMASKELASKALEYYFKAGSEIFINKTQLSIVENYLLGKYACWNKKYRKGVRLLLKSILISPFTIPYRYSLLKTYLPLTFRNN